MSGVAAAEDQNQEIDTRDSIIESLARSYTEDRAKSLEYDDDNDEDYLEIDDDEDIGNPGDDDDDDETLGSNEGEEEAKKEKFYTLKVDGNQSEVEEEKVIDAGIRALQKESAADARLEQANDKLNQANAILRNAENSQPPSAGKKDVVEPPTLNNDELSDITQAIQYGSEEEAAAAIRKIYGANNNTTREQARGLTESDVAAKVSDQLAYQTALDHIQKSPDEGGYSDVFNDPDLMQLAVIKEQELRRTGKYNNYMDLFSEVGKQVREVKARFSNAENENMVGQREQRKLNAQSNAKSAASSAPNNDTGKSPSKRTSVRDTIEEMRISREGSTSDD